MRVAFYAPMKAPDHPVPSGDRRVGRLLIQALVRAGHQPVLASRLRSWTDGTDPARMDRIRRTGGRLAIRLADRWGKAPDRPRAWLSYRVFHKSPDWLGPEVARRLAIPYLIVEASHAERRRSGPWAAGLAAAEAAIAGADAVFAMSSVDAEGLAPLVAGGRLHRLAPFLDAATFAGFSRAGERRRWLGGEEGPWLLAVGMMREGDKERSFGILADALAGLADVPWRLAVVGDGPARKRIQALFDPSHCRFFGRLAGEDVAALMAAADALVWPAVNEAYGMAILEAQAAGLPVVAGASGGVPDIILDGRTGLLAPPGDAGAFGSRIREALADPARRAAMGRAARDNVLARHDIAEASRVLDRVLSALA